MATPFPNSKIELHQWANSILLGIVGFFVVQSYNLLQSDHERISSHETRITVNERSIYALEKESENHSYQINVISEAILAEPFKKRK